MLTRISSLLSFIKALCYTLRLAIVLYRKMLMVLVRGGCYGWYKRWSEQDGTMAREWFCFMLMGTGERFGPLAPDKEKFA